MSGQCQLVQGHLAFPLHRPSERPPPSRAPLPPAPEYASLSLVFSGSSFAYDQTGGRRPPSQASGPSVWTRAPANQALQAAEHLGPPSSPPASCPAPCQASVKANAFQGNPGPGSHLVGSQRLYLENRRGLLAAPRQSWHPGKAPPQANRRTPAHSPAFPIGHQPLLLPAPEKSRVSQAPFPFLPSCNSFLQEVFSSLRFPEGTHTHTLRVNQQKDNTAFLWTRCF